MSQATEQLTREAILALSAGREMDELIARHVMGSSVYREADPRPGTPPVRIVDECGHNVPNYSTDIAAALDVMDRLKRRYVRDVLVEGDTLPLAICRFALLAVL